MGYSVGWTAIAEHDLSEILESVKKEWGDIVAHNVYEKIAEATELLADYPHAGKKHEDYRVWAVKKKNLIFYRANDAEQRIEIYRVLLAKRWRGGEA